MSGDELLVTAFVGFIGAGVGALLLYFVGRAAVTDGMKAYARWRDTEIAAKRAAQEPRS